jgi:hypothetical protein
MDTVSWSVPTVSVCRALKLSYIHVVSLATSSMQAIGNLWRNYVQNYPGLSAPTLVGYPRFYLLFILPCRDLSHTL